MNAVWFGVNVGGILLADPFGTMYWFTVDDSVVAGEPGAGTRRLAKFVSPARNKLTCLCEIGTGASSALHLADAAGSERREGNLLVVGDSRGNILAFPCVLPQPSSHFVVLGLAKLVALQWLWHRRSEGRTSSRQGVL